MCRVFHSRVPPANKQSRLGIPEPPQTYHIKPSVSMPSSGSLKKSARVPLNTSLAERLAVALIAVTLRHRRNLAALRPPQLELLTPEHSHLLASRTKPHE